MSSVYCHELAPGTVTLTGDWVRDDDSKQNSCKDKIVNKQKTVLINKEIPKVTYYYVLILNLHLQCIINFLKVISISKEYFT